MNIKDITIPLIIHYYLLRASEHYTNLSIANHTVYFRVSTGRHNAIRYAQTLCASFNYSGHSRREVPVRAVDIVNPE